MSRHVIFDTGIVELSMGDGVAVIRFGDPGALTLWSERLEAELFAAVDMVASDSSTSVLALLGRGDSFCAGADLAGLRARLDRPDDETAERVLARRVGRMLDLPQLVVAGIHGHCVGIGLALALSCDVRIARADARFQTGFGKRGLVAEHGSAWLLPRIVGTGVALDMLLASSSVDADRALRTGLVTSVVDDLEAGVLEYAERVATTIAPQSVAVMKQQVYRGLDSAYASARADAAHDQADSMRSAAALEGVTSFQENRSPNFPPRTAL